MPRPQFGFGFRNFGFGLLDLEFGFGITGNSLSVVGGGLKNAPPTIWTREGANEGSAKAWEGKGENISWERINPNQITAFPQVARRCPQIGKTALQGLEHTGVLKFMEKCKNNIGQGFISFGLAC